MDNQTAAGVIEQALNTQNPIVQALQAALTILQNGYQSDVESAQAAVASQINDLNSQITDLTSQVTALQTRVDSANAALIGANLPTV